METYAKKRVLILFTGGTIVGNVAQGNVSQFIKTNPDSMLSVIDNSTELIKKNWNIEIKTEYKTISNIDSSNVTPEIWSKLIDGIVEDYDKFDAFIVMHGTNTMGYTASALSFALENINKPVILTGAQVPYGYLGTDASTNLINSLRIAVWGYHPIKGVMGVFGSKIVSGVRLKKGSDFDYDPFASFMSGTIGEIGRYIIINEEALQKHNSYLSKRYPLAIQSRVLHVEKNFDMENIVSISEFPGMNADTFKNLVETQGTKAFILRTFGAGDPNKNLFPAFKYLKKKKIPIVVTTQAPSGVSNFQVNETGQYLEENDLAIPAFDMSHETQSVKMGWLLGQKVAYKDMKTRMLEDLHGEIRVGNELI